MLNKLEKALGYKFRDPEKLSRWRLTKSHLLCKRDLSGPTAQL